MVPDRVRNLERQFVATLAQAAERLVGQDVKGGRHCRHL